MSREVPPPTAGDRLAYRCIVWAKACPFGHRDNFGGSRVCNLGYPGCACADELMRFDELGWVDLYAGLEDFEPEGDIPEFGDVTKLVRNRSTKEKSDWWDAVEEAAETAPKFCTCCLMFGLHEYPDCLCDKCDPSE